MAAPQIGAAILFEFLASREWRHKEWNWLAGW
jgi:hypothetical protein